MDRPLLLLSPGLSVFCPVVVNLSLLHLLLSGLPRAVVISHCAPVAACAVLQIIKIINIASTEQPLFLSHTSPSPSAMQPQGCHMRPFLDIVSR